MFRWENTPEKYRFEWFRRTNLTRFISSISASCFSAYKLIDSRRRVLKKCSFSMNFSEEESPQIIFHHTRHRNKVKTSEFKNFERKFWLFWRRIWDECQVKRLEKGNEKVEIKKIFPNDEKTIKDGFEKVELNTNLFSRLFNFEQENLSKTNHSTGKCSSEMISWKFFFHIRKEKWNCKEKRNLEKVWITFMVKNSLMIFFSKSQWEKNIISECSLEKFDANESWNKRIKNQCEQVEFSTDWHEWREKQ